jgi:hypothetical protein
VSQVHSQGERYVQQGRLIAVPGQSGAIRKLKGRFGAGSKIPAFLIADKTELYLGMLRGALPGVSENGEFKLPAERND